MGRERWNGETKRCEKQIRQCVSIINTRVRLPVEGDGVSDYVNASYVRLVYPTLEESSESELVESEEIEGEAELEAQEIPQSMSRNESETDTSRESSSNDYIAAQGPLENTINQFWSMAYNESEKQNNDVVLIVMVTPLTESGMVKCYKYWPDKEKPTLDLSHSNKRDSIAIPELKVNYITESYDEVGDFLLTEMELVSATKTKKVFHFYYYKWADARVPPSLFPLLYLSEEMNAIRKLVEHTPTPIVHCSAGVGRTGTFIAIDHLFRDFDKFIKLCDKARVGKEYDVVYDPIFKTVLQMREKRMMMVQTAYQFGFLYDSAKVLYKDRLQ